MNTEKNLTELNKGKQLLEAGNLEEAIVVFRRAVQLNTNDSWSYHYLGESLIKQDQFEEAVTVLRQAIELNPDFSWSHHHLGDALSQQQKWEEAIIAFRQAIKLNPKHFGTYVGLGQSLGQISQFEEAISSYEQAIKLKPDTDWIYLGLAAILEQRAQSDTANAIAAYNHVRELNPNYLPVYHKLTQLQPEQVDIWLDFAKTLVKQHQIEDAITAYRRAFQLNPEYFISQYQVGYSLGRQGFEQLTDYHHLGLLLAEEGFFNEAVACFQKLPNPTQNEGVIYESLWKGLNEMGILEEKDTYYPTEINHGHVHTYFTQNSQYTLMDLWSLTETDKKQLDDEGFLIANLNLISQDNWALEEIYINSFSQGETIHLARQTSKILNYVAQPFLNTPNEFQKSIVQTGYIYALCPISGKIIRSQQSFYDVGGMPPMISYRFVGNEVFYLIVGHYWGAKMALYFPRIELIIRITPHIAPQAIVNKLKANMVSYWQEVKRYISSKKEKQIVALAGLNANIGHTLWNEVTGLHYLSENGILQKLDKVIAERYDYFMVGEVFDELVDKVVNISENSSLFKTIIANNYMGVMATNVFIKEDLVEKMSQASLRKCSPIVIQEIEQAKQHFPLLWVGIRIHSRIWVSLVEGTANTIKKLHSEFPKLGVVFDGWSRLETEDPYTEAMIAREQGTLKEILALIPPDIKTYNLIGAKTYEKILWANAIDLYLSSPGSSTTFVLWIANKMGVVHANRIHYATWVDEQLLSRDNATLPVYVPLDFISDQPASPEQLAFNLQNYDFDWQVAYDELVKIINKLIENRS